MNEQFIKQIMSGERRTLTAHALRLGLAALTPGYRAAVALRNATFNRGIRRAANLGRPTISVGNITTGGTGKTPIVIELAQRLARMNHTPAVLLRGYGEDEVQELTAALHGTAIVRASRDRHVAAANALREQPATTVFLLDDAFQRRQVHRDLDLVLIDATNPFGYDHLLPRGLLREPAKNLARADAVILTHCEQVDAQTIDRLEARIVRLHGKPSIAHAQMTWASLRERDPFAQDIERPLGDLSTLRVAGVCGVGNPHAFFAMLEQAAGRVVMQTALADHQIYDAERLGSLLEQAHAAGAEAVVTTEKDYVKWQTLLDALPGNIPHLPILRPKLAVQFTKGGDALDALVQASISGKSPRPL